MSIIAILVFIVMMCAAIYLTAIYALPILAGLAACSLLKQIGASATTIAIVSTGAALAAFAAARASASARSDAIRLVASAIIATSAGYAGYSATTQLARLFGVPEQRWAALSVVAAFVVAALSIDRIVIRPQHGALAFSLPLRLSAQSRRRRERGV